jgi:hypothetical protein
MASHQHRSHGHKSLPAEENGSRSSRLSGEEILERLTRLEAKIDALAAGAVIRPQRPRLRAAVDPAKIRTSLNYLKFSLEGDLGGNRARFAVPIAAAQAKLGARADDWRVVASEVWREMPASEKLGVRCDFERHRDAHPAA